MNHLSTTTVTSVDVRPFPNLTSTLEDARQYLRKQGEALNRLSRQLDSSFSLAVGTILGRPGRVVVCGLGKSGLIGRKIAATLSSTGTPAFFLHASEALHGDLGMVTSEDTILMISNSGETEEVVRILRPIQHLGIPVIALAGNGNSTLAQKANVFLDISVDREACPLNLAPTTSTLVTLALGDAIAMTLSQARGFRENDFARCHPGGSLGRKLCTHVSDVMRTESLPFVKASDGMAEVMVTMTEGRCGAAIVLQNGKLAGIITDGDLRRAFQKTQQIGSKTARDVMTNNPLVIRETATLADAEELMRTHRIKILLAVNAQEKVCGVVEIYAP